MKIHVWIEIFLKSFGYSGFDEKKSGFSFSSLIVKLKNKGFEWLTKIFKVFNSFILNKTPIIKILEFEISNFWMNKFFLILHI